MDQRDQRQRRPSAVDRINNAVGTAKKIQNAYKLARAAGTAAEVISTSEVWIPIVIVAAVILIFVIIIIGATGGSATSLGGANPAPTTNPTTSIASCPVSEGQFQRLLTMLILLMGTVAIHTREQVFLV